MNVRIYKFIEMLINICRHGLGLMLFVVILASNLWASGPGTTAMDFLRLTHSTRSEALGGSLTAESDFSALSINPASIGVENRLLLEAHTLSYFEGMTYHNLSVLLPFSWANVALTGGFMDFGSQLRTTVSSPSGSGDYFDNQSSYFSIAIARDFSALSLGVAVKWVSEELDTTTADALGLDLGVQYQVSDALFLGASATNITLSEAQYISESDGLLQENRVGLMWQDMMWGRRFMCSIDYVMASDSTSYWGVGVETQLLSFFQFRLGYSTASDVSDISLGFGLELMPMTVDFTYKPSDAFDQSYRLGVGVAF